MPFEEYLLQGNFSNQIKSFDLHLFLLGLFDDVFIAWSRYVEKRSVELLRSLPEARRADVPTPGNRHLVRIDRFVPVLGPLMTDLFPE